jgi:hypothetical protein
LQRNDFEKIWQRKPMEFGNTCRIASTDLISSGKQCSGVPFRHPATDNLLNEESTLKSPIEFSFFAFV